MSYSETEKVVFCGSIVADTSTNAPAPWKAGPIGTGRPIRVVSVQNPQGVFIPAYAEIRSDFLTPAPDVPQNVPQGSTWRLLRGRWPIQYTNVIVAAAWATYVLIEYRSGAPLTFERHQVFLLDDFPPAQADVEGPRSVQVWLGGNNTAKQMTITAQGQEQFIQTTDAFGPLSAIMDVAGSTEAAMVAGIKAFAAGKGFNLIP